MKKYYECHIFYNRHESFSVFFSTDKDFKYEEDLLREAVEQKKLAESDAEHVDYVEELTEDEYNTFTGPSLATTRTNN